MAFIHTPELIKEYARQKNRRHSYYEDAVKNAEDLSIHMDGEFPEDLIGKARPGETETVMKYRKDIDQPITKDIMSRVVSLMQKGRRSPDFTIKFDLDNVPTTIREGERPQDYLTTGFPEYTSVTNWMFQGLLRQYIVDSNAWVATQPVSFDITSTTDYIKPVPIIYDADDVYDYVKGEYFVCKSEEISTYTTNPQTGATGNGLVFYVYTPTEIVRYSQSDSAFNFRETGIYTHNFNYIPLRQTKGVVVDDNFINTLCESRFAPMVPYLNEARREYSDLQLSVVHHMHPLMWYYKSQQCTKCNGTGKVKKTDGAPIKCKECKGSGYPGFNPLEAVGVDRGEPGANPPPTPPAGIIPRDTEVLKIQNDRIEAHKYNALAAMNLQNLQAVSTDLSGIAKEVDRDEQHNLTHSVMEDLVAITDGVITDIINYRYALIPEADRMKLRPTINVPERFDILSSSMIIDDVTKLTTANADPILIKAAQLQLADKMFPSDDATRDMIKLKLTLDPLAGMSMDDVNLGVQTGLVSKVKAVVKSNISDFIERALQEVKEFKTLDRSAQQKVLYKYAQEEINAAKLIEPTTPQQQP